MGWFSSIFGPKEAPKQTEQSAAERETETPVPEPQMDEGPEGTLEDLHHETIIEEPIPTASLRYRGSVKDYKEGRGFGFLKVEFPPRPGQTEVFVHIHDVKERTCLYRGEPVEFALEQDEGGKTRAVEVVASTRRYHGRVKKWLGNERFGFVECAEIRSDVFVHYRDIHAEGPRELFEGEPVEFFLEKNAEGRDEATCVQVFQSRFPIERFGDIRRFNEGELLEQLRELAQDEDWEYKRSRSDKPYPVLWSYVVYTFARLVEENKIGVSINTKKENVACANTGLVTRLQEEIYAYFTEGKKDRWVLSSFLKSSDRRLSCFEKLPSIANYFVDPSDLLYNPDKTLRINVDHILKDNLYRFPKDLQANTFALRNALLGAVDAAKQRVRRNYKTAIPQFFQGKLQLLLPLCLTNPGQADLALVVSRDNEIYIASTVLPLDMAYNNARLIARPDREWLEP